MSLITFQNNRKLDLIPMGRIGVDLNAVEVNRPIEEVVTFKKTVGGSPANIAIGASRLGLNVGFIGQVSADGLGRFCRITMEKENVDTTHILIDQSGRMNGLALTEIISPSECQSILYRDGVADLYMKPEDIQREYIEQSKILLISGTALAQSPSREATLQAIEYATESKTKIIFELDYRAYSWQSKEETAHYYQRVAAASDIILGTEDEYRALTGTKDHSELDKSLVARQMLAKGSELVIIKQGSDGSIGYAKDEEVIQVKPFRTQVLKTQGAGDAYAAGLICGLINGWSIKNAMEYGSATASIVVSRNSCSEAMPTNDEVIAKMETSKTT
ncbi:5-dehydro-2-deoxygluconokinase [Bacillaceae bacterium SIJ1]|uniref:5-dehydro-2-deoxygluconokinase n=1 Tax=Litoribacterium kuwaitense TaxID=1398745 RepID=UPI0013EA77CB|nr:5-dehydro-2-deoxygluconokinase [Litoribacterium kuwaitense]NGP43815.1 5-dehydro-2-deoxygluconokinase [Litoribacterium kuwaitense]